MTQKPPRQWAILFVVDRLGTLYNHFHLQKILFLAKVEAKVPVQYSFFKYEYGPYSQSIKLDAWMLSSRGLLDMSWDSNRPRWIFRKTDSGSRALMKWLPHISESHAKHFAAIVDKFSRINMSALRSYVYKHHIREESENDLIRASIRDDAAELLTITESYPVSHNTAFARGALSYCLSALRKPRPRDVVHQDYLLRTIYGFVESLNETLSKVGEDKSAFTLLDLRDLEEEFELVQEVCKELNILPCLDDMSLAELTS